MQIRSHTIYAVHLVVILVWQFGFDRQIQYTSTLIVVMCIMRISQAIYTHYCSFRQTKFPPICITFRFAKLDVHQIYCVYGMSLNQKCFNFTLKFIITIIMFNF